MILAIERNCSCGVNANDRLNPRTAATQATSLGTPFRNPRDAAHRVSMVRASDCRKDRHPQRGHRQGHVETQWHADRRCDVARLVVGRRTARCRTQRRRRPHDPDGTEDFFFALVAVAGTESSRPRHLYDRQSEDRNRLREAIDEPRKNHRQLPRRQIRTECQSPCHCDQSHQRHDQPARCRREPNVDVGERRSQRRPATRYGCPDRRTLPRRNERHEDRRQDRRRSEHGKGNRRETEIGKLPDGVCRTIREAVRR